MTRFPYVLFVLILAIAAIILVTTTGQLPAQVASHFAGAGSANGWMGRSDYLVFMLALGIGMPVLVVAAVGALPRMMVGSINIPNRDLWLTPARRDETLRYLSAHSCWLGCLLAAFITGVHIVLLLANATQPPQLPGTMFYTVLVAFLIGLVLWIVALHARFRNRN